jgi:hypothetical protein
VCAGIAACSRFGGKQVLQRQNYTNGGDGRPLVPVTDFREISDFTSENL